MNWTLKMVTTLESRLWERGVYGARLNVSGERAELWSGPEGRRRRTTLADPFRPKATAAFENALRLWRQFAETQALMDFSLLYQQRTQRLLGPPPRRHRPPPEWRISATFSTRALGVLTLTRHFQQGIPPHRELMAEWRLLRRLPLSPVINQPSFPILIQGDRLARFLAPAMGYLRERESETGLWLAQSHGFPTNRSDELDSPTEFRFTPATIRPPSPKAWRALHYDGDREMLLCLAPDGGACRAVQLSDSLYRFFDRLIFVGDASREMIKGVRHILPSAILEF